MVHDLAVSLLSPGGANSPCSHLPIRIDSQERAKERPHKQATLIGDADRHEYSFVRGTACSESLYNVGRITQFVHPEGCRGLAWTTLGLHERRAEPVRWLSIYHIPYPAGAAHSACESPVGNAGRRLLGCYEWRRC